MARLNDVLTAVLTKAGYQATDPLVAELLSNSQIGEIEVNDEVATGVNSRLISLDAAKKGHPEIRKVYRTEVLNGIDQQLSQALDLLELPDDEREAFLSETNTYKKVGDLAEIIKKVKASKADASPADKKAHNDAIANLQNQLKAAKDELNNERTNFQDLRKKDRREFALKDKIKNFKTILDGINETTKFATCNTVVDSLLNEYDAELIADENGQLKLQTKDGQDVYNNKTNTVIPADEFLEMALTQNKLLVTATPVHSGNENGQGIITEPIPNAGGNANTKQDNTTKAVNEFNAKAKALMGIK